LDFHAVPRSGGAAHREDRMRSSRIGFALLPLGAVLALGGAAPAVAQQSGAFGGSDAGRMSSGFMTVSATGTLRAPSDGRATTWPSTVGFTAADVATGRWSMEVVLDRAARDTDPDPWVGRYIGAVRSARITLGDATLQLPAAAMQVTVSDGGLGAPWRESVRIEVAVPQPDGDVLRVAWVQLNPQATTHELRGAAGCLSGDALPAPAAYEALQAASPFDSFLLVRLDPPEAGARPRAYVASSIATVAAHDGGVAR
jgi:hypothetical protein